MYSSLQVPAANKDKLQLLVENVVVQEKESMDGTRETAVGRKYSKSWKIFSCPLHSATGATKSHGPQNTAYKT